MTITQRAFGLGAGLIAFLCFSVLGISNEPDDLDAPPPGVDVETRGPVHEAFFQPNDLQPEPGLPVPKAPPAALPEMPPEQRPEGEANQWIPGYWAWDAERNDYVWVSGTFRETPPGRRWVPGHWTHTDEGWRWVPGFWAPENQEDIPFTPEPPAPLDDGPRLPPPNDNSLYVPGYWNYADERFAWRPGYWAPVRPGRCWVSPRYLWTPNGYLFVNGYWDFPLEDRGLLFAPAYFNRPLWNDPLWVYRPTFIVSINTLFDSCFYRPRSSHFFFGNFYGNHFARIGFQPWHDRRHDPAFAYHQWRHRGEPNWMDGQRRLHQDRLAGRVALPPSTFAQQRALTAKLGPKAGLVNAGQPIVPLRQAGGMPGSNLRLVMNNRVDVQKANIDRVREVANLRSRVEGGKSFATPGSIPGEPKFGVPGSISPNPTTARVQPPSIKLPPPAVRSPRPAVNFPQTTSPSIGRLPGQPGAGLPGAGPGGAKVLGKPQVTIPSEVFDRFRPRSGAGQPGAVPGSNPSANVSPGVGLPNVPNFPGAIRPAPKSILPSSPPGGLPTAPNLGRVNPAPSPNIGRPPINLAPPGSPIRPLPSPSPATGAPRVGLPQPNFSPPSAPPAPRINVPRVEMPRPAPLTPRPNFNPPSAPPAPRINVPRVEMPRPAPLTPRPNFNPPSAPPAPRINVARVEMPRPAPAAPRINFALPPAPRVNVPRAEMPRPIPAAPRVNFSPPAARNMPSAPPALRGAPAGPRAGPPGGGFPGRGGRPR